MIQSGGFLLDTYLQGSLGPPTKNQPKPSEPLLFSYLNDIII